MVSDLGGWNPHGFFNITLGWFQPCWPPNLQLCISMLVDGPVASQYLIATSEQPLCALHALLGWIDSNGASHGNWQFVHPPFNWGIITVKLVGRCRIDSVYISPTDSPFSPFSHIFPTASPALRKEILEEKTLPRRYAGLSTCFRSLWLWSEGCWKTFHGFHGGKSTRLLAIAPRHDEVMYRWWWGLSHQRIERQLHQV